MRKKIGLSAAALFAVTSFAFVGAACSKKVPDSGNGMCTVTFDANGGTFSGAGTTVTKTVEPNGYVTMTNEENPSRENFVFYGWLKDASDVISVDLSATAIAADTTFYAGWRRAADITFYYNYEGAPNGGIYMTNVLAAGSVITQPTSPERADGYVFDCWTTDTEGNSEWDFTSDKANNSVELYAQWLFAGEEQTTHSVTLNIDGAETAFTVPDGTAFDEPEDPTMQGYDFIEWRVGSLNGAVYDFTSPVTSDIELYAYFVEESHELQSYTVKLHVGDKATEHTVSENSVFAKPEDPTMQGYDFIEWRVGSLNGAVYDFTSPVTSDIELFAYFDQEHPVDEHNITYILDDGESTVAVNAGENPTIFTEGETVTLVSPTRSAYTFEGWFTDENFTDEITEIPAAAKNDVTLYAKWRYDYPFFITGYDNNWTKYADLKNKTDDDAEKTSHTFYPYIEGEGENRTWDGKTYIAERVYISQGSTTNHGYKIINANKWYGIGGSSADSAKNLKVSSSGYYTVKIVAQNNAPNSITVNAEPRKVNVSFVTGNENISVAPIECNDGSKLTAPTVKGYTVDKWYSDESKSVMWDFDTDIVTEHTILYAGEIAPKKIEVEYIEYDRLVWTKAVTEVDYGSMLDLTYTLETGYTDSAVTVKVNGKVVTGGTYTVDTEAKIRIVAEGDIKKNIYTVIFNQFDGTKISEVKIEHGNPAVAPTPANITGKRFTGWSSDIDSVTENKTVTAVYEWIDYTVTFNPNGGTEIAPVNAHYGDKIIEPVGVVKTDSVLDGWYTDPNGETGKWNFESNTMPAADIELYAKWVRDESITWYEVHYKLNKTDPGIYSTVGVSENGVISKPTDPIQAGYEFDKWFDSATDKEYAFGAKPTEDVTLYATWTLKAPTVTLNNVTGEYKVGGYALTAMPSHELSDATYTYKWYKVVDGSETLISGATGSSYAVASVADSGEYKVEVTAIVGELTSTSSATATVAISKASLPAISGIAFKGGKAYNCAIVFNADPTNAAANYIINIYDSNNAVVFTDRIATGSTETAKEIAVNVPLKGEYTVKISYDGFESADVHNTEAASTLGFKGNGTAACPFDVSTVEDLKQIAEHKDAYFVQVSDIIVDGNSNLTALFTSENSFKGSYDGNSHSINGITDSRGLFGYIGMGATVKDLAVTVKLSSSTTDYMGGVAAENDGTIKGVTVKGSVKSERGTVNNDTQKTLYGIGGIVGKNNGTVENCTNEATLSGKITVGGIVGYNTVGAKVTKSVNEADIGSTSAKMSWAGGLVGLNAGRVERSQNTASVNATKGSSSSGNGCNYIAGFVGENESGGVITECKNSGNVRCDYAAAGMSGINNGTVEFCENSGRAEARWAACGGSVEGSGTFNKCVFTGSVSATSGGGAYAVKNGTTTYCYYKNGTAPSGTGNAKYDVSTDEKRNAMLAVLGDKFTYDGANVTLKFTIT